MFNNLKDKIKGLKNGIKNEKIKKVVDWLITKIKVLVGRYKDFYDSDPVKGFLVICIVICVVSYAFEFVQNHDYQSSKPAPRSSVAQTQTQQISQEQTVPVVVVPEPKNDEEITQWQGFPIIKEGKIYYEKGYEKYCVDGNYRSGLALSGNRLYEPVKLIIPLNNSVQEAVFNPYMITPESDLADFAFSTKLTIYKDKQIIWTGFITKDKMLFDQDYVSIPFGLKSGQLTIEIKTYDEEGEEFPRGKQFPILLSNFAFK